MIKPFNKNQNQVNYDNLTVFRLFSMTKRLLLLVWIIEATYS